MSRTFRKIKSLSERQLRGKKQRMSLKRRYEQQAAKIEDWYIQLPIKRRARDDVYTDGMHPAR